MRNLIVFLWISVLLCLCFSPAFAKDNPPSEKSVDTGTSGESVGVAESDADRSQVTKSLEGLSEGMDGDLRRGGFSGSSLAVMSFTESGKLAKEKELGSAAASEIHSFMGKYGWTMVERERLAEVLKEIELSQTGIIDDDKAVEVAGLAGADILIVGSVSEVGDRFLINVRAVDKGTATAVSVQKAEVHSASLIALSSKAVVLRTRWDATYRSMVAPGWGQFYNDQPIKAGIFIALEAGAVAAVIGLHIAHVKAYDEYKKADPPQWKIDEKYDEARKFLLWRNIMAGGIGAIWAAGVIDAALNGETYTRTETGVEGPAVSARDFSPALLGAPDDPAPGVTYNLNF